MRKRGALRARWLALACLLLAPIGAFAAKPVAQVVSFGDSLSDCGVFGFKPTTVPSPTWNELLARHLGDTLLPNRTGVLPGISAPGTVDAQLGGLCYAQGGARTATGVPGKPEQLPISGAVQLDHFLAEHGHFAPNQLVAVYLGANDILINYAGLNARLGDGAAPAESLAAVRVVVARAGKDVGVLVGRMLDAGAAHVAVLNAYDFGDSDFIAAGPILTGLTDDFNAALAAALPNDGRVIRIDTHGLFAKLAAHPGAFGFSHPMNDDACTTPVALGPDCYASPEKWKSPDADRTHILVGMVHFTARTEALLADYVIARVGPELRR